MKEGKWIRRRVERRERPSRERRRGEHVEEGKNGMRRIGRGREGERERDGHAESSARSESEGDGRAGKEKERWHAQCGY